MPGFLPALGAAGASTLLDALFTGDQNRRSREWEAKRYQVKRDDAIAFWNMQNEYNSPANQMKRLQQAGLSPALMYGKGASPGVAGPLETPDFSGAQFRTPQIGQLGNVLSQYYDMDIKQAQANALRAQTATALEEASLKRAQRSNIQSSTERTKFDLELDRELRQTSADFRREQLRKMRADTAYTLAENERKAAMNGRNIIESVERVLSMRVSRANTRAERKRIYEQIKNIRKDTNLKQLDIELRREGIMPSDPMYMRILGRILGGSSAVTPGRDLKLGFFEGLKDAFKF